MPTLYLDGRQTGFAKATKTCPAHKLYWGPLNWKRSLPVLKWTSESEYFLSFEIFFADTIYIYSLVPSHSPKKPKGGESGFIGQIFGLC